MLNNKIAEILICPACGRKINFADKIICNNCNTIYPLVEGIPILINENNSLFSIEQFIKKENTTVNLNMHKRIRIRKMLTKLLPSITKNFKAKANFTKFRNFLNKAGENPVVLIIGGGALGVGINEVIEDKKLPLSKVIFHLAQERK